MDILLYFRWTSVFGLHGFNKLALASILLRCDGRPKFMRMSLDNYEVKRRQPMEAFSRNEN